MNYKEYNQIQIYDSVEAFKDHVITFEDNNRGHWIITRKRNGVMESCFKTEVICLYNNSLYVGGDIDAVVFAYGPQDFLSRVAWIGKDNPSMDYIRGKACIGTGFEMKSWDRDVALTEYDRFLKEEDENEKIKDIVREMIDMYDREEIINTISNDVYSICPETAEQLYNSGMVPSHRVYTAWAAVNRLNHLLDNNKGE